MAMLGFPSVSRPHQPCGLVPATPDGAAAAFRNAGLIIARSPVPGRSPYPDWQGKNIINTFVSRDVVNKHVGIVSRRIVSEPDFDEHKALKDKRRP
jgi:hypothetical protein